MLAQPLDPAVVGIHAWARATSGAKHKPLTRSENDSRQVLILGEVVGPFLAFMWCVFWWDLAQRRCSRAGTKATESKRGAPGVGWHGWFGANATLLIKRRKLAFALSSFDFKRPLHLPPFELQDYHTSHWEMRLR
jgi:hypothetical protein